MNVLVCCEESQAVCKAFREKGHYAFSCDIQRCSGGHPEWHINADCLQFLDAHRNNRSISFFTEDNCLHCSPGRWDLIIAHPPCTYLARSSSCNMYVNGKIDFQRYENMILAKQFFMNFYNLSGRVAIENPVPMKLAGLPRFTQTIQPYEFGDNYTKLTCLWLKNLPYLMPLTYACPGEKRNFAISWCSVRSGSKNRSKTFKGIACAMAQQWQF